MKLHKGIIPLLIVIGIISVFGLSNLINGVAINVNALDDGFGASDENGEWLAETHANIFHTTRYDNNLLYPGASKSYSFQVQNSGKKYTECQLRIVDKNEYKLPLEFKLKKNGEYIVGTQDTWYNSPSIDTGLYEFRGIDNYELEWRWVYLSENEKDRGTANAYDTAIGIKAYTEEEPYYLNIILYGQGGTDKPELVTPDPDPVPHDQPSQPDEPDVPDEPLQPDNQTHPFIPVITGDNSWEVVTIAGIVALISAVILGIGGIIDDWYKKKKVKKFNY